MCMTLHLSALNFNCQVSDHDCRLSRSACKTTFSASVLILHQSFVSSANIFMSHLIQDGSSFTYSRKSSGPKTLPCGTPLNTSSSCEKVPLSPTFIVLEVRKSSSRCNNFPLIPKLFSFLISRRCVTLSNAFRQSRYTTSKPYPSPNAFVQFSNVSRRLVRHDLPLQNPCCSLHNKSFDSRNLISLSLMMDSMILHGTDVNQTGR